MNGTDKLLFRKYFVYSLFTFNRSPKFGFLHFPVENYISNNKQGFSGIEMCHQLVFWKNRKERLKTNQFTYA